MEDIILSWELFAAPYVALVFLALVRVIFCKDVFNTFPWDNRTENPQGKRACIICLVMAAVFALLAAVVSGMYLYATEGPVVAFAVAFVGLYIFLISSMVVVYLLEGIFFAIATIGFFSYMLISYFKK